MLFAYPYAFLYSLITVSPSNTDTFPLAIILQKAVEVEAGDTPEVLQRRVMEQAEWKILPKAIDLIANGKVSVLDGLTVIKE